VDGTADTDEQTGEFTKSNKGKGNGGKCIKGNAAVENAGNYCKPPLVVC
jgi:hypothetical protein